MLKKDIDVVTMAIINNSLVSIIDEMDLAIVRTTTSLSQRDHYDFLCSLATVDGEVIAEGEETVMHANLCDPVIHDWVKTHGIDSIHPDDMICINDPFTGASHFPDLTIIHPIFYEGKLVAWIGAGGHLMDVGGRVAGSCSCDARESWEEGLRIPPVKIYDRGVRNDTFFTLLAANSRLGEGVVDQLETFLAACRIGERRFLELIQKHGWETLDMYLKELLDYAERRARADIKALPNGVYEFEDYMDDDGFNSDPILFHVKVTVHDDSMTYDFTGSAAQIKAGMNNPWATTKALVYTALRSLISLDIPKNGGPLRTLNIIAPKGTIVNPVLPAATGARGVTVARIYETIAGAHAQITPEKIPACGEGINTMAVLSGYDEQNRFYLLVDLPWAGWGGRPYADGDQLAPPYYNSILTPAEVNEELCPLMIRQRGFVPDSEGAGKYRGGFALVTDYEALTDGTTLQLRTDRRKIPNYGLNGGKPGSLAKMTLNPDGENRDLPKILIPLKKKDVFRAKVGGGGGWGNPLDRDVQSVLNDVRNELVSIERARNAYGVVINKATLEVDIDATQKLRETMRPQT